MFSVNPVDWLAKLLICKTISKQSAAKDQIVLHQWLWLVLLCWISKDCNFKIDGYDCNWNFDLFWQFYAVLSNNDTKISLSSCVKVKLWMLQENQVSELNI